MRRIVVSILLVLVVATMFAGMVRAEDFGYWPSETGEAAPATYKNNDLWRALWVKSLARVYTKDIYAPYPYEDVKLGTAVVSIFPVYYTTAGDGASFRFFVNVFVIYYAGDYYTNTPPAQRTNDEAWWIHYVNLTLSLDSNRNNMNIKHGYKWRLWG